MEILVKGRNAVITDKFREHVAEKLEKIELFAPRTQRIEVELTHEKNPRLTDIAEKIEITVTDRGPVIRAEAASLDRYSALDLACAKLFERLRRAHDRRKSHRRDKEALQLPEEFLLPQDQNDAPSVENPLEECGCSVPTKVNEAVETQIGDSPVIVRQKLHEATKMSVEEAIDQMELVGHPFFLFIDAQTSQPCVAYRRHGWTYGVIRLDAVVS